MPVTSTLARFGTFELDLKTGDLSKNGRKLRLQEQPFRILNLLLEQPGQPITRDRLKEVLWPSDTFVDFDHSLNGHREASAGAGRFSGKSPVRRDSGETRLPVYCAGRDCR